MNQNVNPQQPLGQQPVGQQPQQTLSPDVVAALKDAPPEVARNLYMSMGIPVPPEIEAAASQGSAAGAPPLVGGINAPTQLTGGAPPMAAPQPMAGTPPMAGAQNVNATPMQPPSGMQPEEPRSMASAPPPPPAPPVEKPMDPTPPAPPAPPVGGQVLPDGTIPQPPAPPTQADQIQPDQGQTANPNAAPDQPVQQHSNANTAEQAPLPATSQDLGSMMEQDANDGMSDMTAEDLAIPRLVILQALSPQVDTNNAEAVQGATAGQFLLTPQNLLLGSSARIVPLVYKRSYIEWKLRDQGGGFVRNHGSDDSILRQTQQNEKNQDILPNGNQIVNTAEYIVAILNDDGSHSLAAFSLSSTAMKKSRQWNALMNSINVAGASGKPFNPPMYAGIYTARLVHEKNEKGGWYSPEFNFESLIDKIPNGSELYSEFKARRDALKNLTLSHTNTQSQGGAVQNWEDDSQV